VEFVLDDVVTVLGSGGELDPVSAPDLTPERRLVLYQRMVTARRLDVAMGQLRDHGKIIEHHSTRGEEAVTVASASALNEGDWLVPSGRDAAAILAKGVSVELWVSHVLGNLNDPSKGRQRPDRFCSRSWKVLSANPRGASQLTQAVGVAWGCRARGDGSAVLCLFDDVAAETGEFHNAANFAGVFGAPLVMIARSREGSEVARRAFAYGITPARVDASDALAVYSVVRSALDRARRGEGATLIEACMSDRDPLVRLRTHLEAAGVFEAQADFDKECDAVIARAIAEASAVQHHAPTTLFDDVYASLPWHLSEQREAVTRR
jgi:pyruvate dehydrogenase E1 component alpha subunit